MDAIGPRNSRGTSAKGAATYQHGPTAHEPGPYQHSRAEGPPHILRQLRRLPISHTTAGGKQHPKKGSWAMNGNALFKSTRTGAKKLLQWELAKHITTHFFSDETTRYRRAARSGTPVRAKILETSLGAVSLWEGFNTALGIVRCAWVGLGP